MSLTGLLNAGRKRIEQFVVPFKSKKTNTHLDEIKQLMPQLILQLLRFFSVVLWHAHGWFVSQSVWSANTTTLHLVCKISPPWPFLGSLGLWLETGRAAHHRSWSSGSEQSTLLSFSLLSIERSCDSAESYRTAVANKLDGECAIRAAEICSFSLWIIFISSTSMYIKHGSFLKVLPQKLKIKY